MANFFLEEYAPRQRFIKLPPKPKILDSRTLWITTIVYITSVSQVT